MAGFSSSQLVAGQHTHARTLPLGAGRSGGRLVVTSVATPTKNPTSRLAKRSKVEIIKEKSDYLRHPLMQELKSEQPNISEEAMQLMKFHGSYMQDNREQRAFGQGKSYQFMMRTRQPAGLVTNQLYLAMDDLANEVGGADGGVGRGVQHALRPSTYMLPASS